MNQLYILPKLTKIKSYLAFLESPISVRILFPIGSSAKVTAVAVAFIVSWFFADLVHCFDSWFSVVGLFNPVSESSKILAQNMLLHAICILLFRGCLLFEQLSNHDRHAHMRFGIIYWSNKTEELFTIHSWSKSAVQWTNII